MLPNSTSNQWLRLHERMKGRRWADYLSDDDSSFSFAQSRSKNFVGASQSTVHGSRLGSVQLLQPDMSGSRGMFGSMSQSQRRNAVEQVLPPTESKIMSMMLSSSDENRFLTNRPKEGGSSHWRTINEPPRSGESQGSGGQSGVPLRKFPNGFAGIMSHLSATEDNVNQRVSSKEKKAEGNMASNNLCNGIKDRQDGVLKAGGSDLMLVSAEVASTNFSKPSAGVPRRRLMPLPLTTPMISDSAGMLATKLTTVIPPKSAQSPVIMASDSLSVSASSSSRFSSAVFVPESQQLSQRSATAISNLSCSALPSDSVPIKERKSDCTANSAMWHTTAELPILQKDATCTSFDANSDVAYAVTLAAKQETTSYLPHGGFESSSIEAQDWVRQENKGIDVQAEQDHVNVAPHSAPLMPAHPMAQWPGWHPGYWNMPPQFPLPSHAAAPAPQSAYSHQTMPYPPLQPPFMSPWPPYYYPPFPVTPQQGHFMPPIGGTPYPYPSALYPWGYGQPTATHPGMPQCMPIPADAYYAQQQMDQYHAYWQEAQLSASHAGEPPNPHPVEPSICVESEITGVENQIVAEEHENVVLPQDHNLDGECAVVLFPQPQDRLAALSVGACQFQFGSVDIEQLQADDVAGVLGSSNAYYPLTSVPEEGVAQGGSCKTSKSGFLPSVMLLRPGTEASVTTPDPTKTYVETDVMKRSVGEKFLSVDQIEERKGSGTATNSTAVGAPSSSSFRLQETDDDALLTDSASKQEFKVEKTPTVAFPLVVTEAHFGDDFRREQHHGGGVCSHLERTSICNETGDFFPPLAEDDTQPPSHVSRQAKMTSKTASKRKRGGRNNEPKTTEAAYSFGLTSSTNAQREPKLSSKAKRRQARRASGTKPQQQHSGSNSTENLRSLRGGLDTKGGVEEVDSVTSLSTATNKERFKTVSSYINAKDASNRYIGGIRNVPLNSNSSSGVFNPRSSPPHTDAAKNDSVDFCPTVGQIQHPFSNEAVYPRQPFKPKNQEKRKDDIRSLAAELWKQDLSAPAVVPSGASVNSGRNSYGSQYNNSRPVPVVCPSTKLPSFPLSGRGIDHTARGSAVVIPSPPCTPADVSRHTSAPSVVCNASRDQRQGMNQRLNELSPNTDARRLRHIEKVMASADYLAFNRAVPRGMRRNSDPLTPSTKGTSHRSFLDELSIWKVQLRAFTNTRSTVGDLQTGGGCSVAPLAHEGAPAVVAHKEQQEGSPSANKRRSLLREFAFSKGLLRV